MVRNIANDGCLSVICILLIYYWGAFKQGSKAASQGCSYEKVFWKYAADLQLNTHAEVRF